VTMRVSVRQGDVVTMKTQTRAWKCTNDLATKAREIRETFDKVCRPESPYLAPMRTLFLRGVFRHAEDVAYARIALERGGKVHTIIVKDRKKAGLQACVKEHVKAGAVLYSDALASYDGLAQEYAHKVIDHAEKYVDGQIHTQGLDNFWSLLKRGLNGTYVSVEPFHLFRYLDEQMFRYNYRGNREHKITDADRFNMVLSQVAGKRLTYQQVTGKVGETSF